MNIRILPILMAAMAISAAAWAAAPAPGLVPATAAPADPYAAVVTYQVGQSREPLTAIEDEVRTAGAERAPALEAKLLAALKSPQATTDAKRFLCRTLRVIATAQSVPALADLLADANLSHVASDALGRISDPAAEEALLKALPAVGPKAKIEIVSTLGLRGEVKAVPDLAKLLADKDEALADTAMSALGNIGGPDAVAALSAAKPGQALAVRRADSLLRCAEKFLAAGQSAQAAAIYKQLAGEGPAPIVQVAILQGTLKTNPQGAVQLLREAIVSKDNVVQRGAIALTADVSGSEACKAFAATMNDIPPAAQVTLLAALTERGDSAARPAVLAAVKSADDAVRVAAVKALGRLGEGGDVDMLAKLAAAGGAESQSAREALVSMPAKDADAAMIALLSGGETKTRVEVIHALRDRAGVAARSAVEGLLKDADAAIQLEATTALGALGDGQSLALLIGVMVKPAGEANRQAAQAAAEAVCIRLKKPDVCAALLVKALDASDAPAQAALVRVLPRAGGAKALEAVRNAVKSALPQVHEAAMYALCEWAEPDAAGDLLDLARGTAGGAKFQVLALRGYIRLAAVPADRPAAQRVKMYQDALALAKRPDEKRLVLAGLGEMKDVEALKLVRQLMDDKDVPAEACLAAVNVATQLRDNPAAAADIREAMKLVPKLSKDKRLIGESGAILKALDKK